MLKKFKFCFIFLFSINLLCCNKSNEIKMHSLSGYLAWQQKNWTKATANFYKALEISENDLKEYSEYNIASTYLMQNEDESANIKLKNNSNVKNNFLRSSIAYQKGIIAFKNQKYEDAIKFFKEAIEYNPNEIDAKINYELSKKNINSQKKQATTNKKAKIDQNEKTEINSAIVNLIRQKEENKWEKEIKTKEKKNINDF